MFCLIIEIYCMYLQVQTYVEYVPTYPKAIH